MRAVHALLLVILVPPGVAGAVSCITEHLITTTASGITTGPDGNIWFTTVGAIGRIDPGNPNAPTYFPLSLPTLPGAWASAIVSGPDGNLWFTEPERNLIARIAPAAPNIIDEFPAPASGSYPGHMTVGPDGRLWFTGFQYVARFAPTDPGIIEVFPLGPYFDPGEIVTGPDGNLWFTLFSSGAVARILADPPHTIDVFPLGLDDPRPLGMTSGPDGNLWFTVVRGNRIGRIEPVSPNTITQFVLPLPDSHPRFITVGADGDLWFTQATSASIGRIAPLAPNAISEFAVPSGLGPERIVLGPDGALWFTEVFTGAGSGSSGRQIGRLALDACCGDGQIGPDEQCDDGNGISGDGCSATCTLEACFTCDAAEPTGCVPFACTSGDGCCPSGCDRTLDHDCSTFVPISGTKLVIRDHPDARRRKIVFVSNDTALDTTLASGITPRVHGAALQLYNPGTGESLCLPLADYIWTSNASPTLRYRDGGSYKGPCRKAVVRGNPSGRGGVLKVTCDASTKPIGFSLDEPAQQQIAALFSSNRTIYCALFGGTVTEEPGKKFIGKKAPSPAACAAPPVLCY